MSPGWWRGQAGVCGQSLGRRLSISLRKGAPVFQTEVYTILAFVYEIQTNAGPKKYVSIFSDCQVALKALQAAKTSPLAQHCRKALNDISTWHVVGLYWVPGHTEVQGNENTNKLTGDSSLQKFVGPELSLGVCRQNINRRIKRVDNKHLVMWCSLNSNQRHPQTLISGHSLTTKTRFLYFNTTQSWVVIGLLTRHNTLRRYLHLMGLTNSLLCRRFGAEEETSAYILVWVPRLGFTHTYMSGLLFLGPRGY